jgi:hypothetical protein
VEPPIQLALEYDPMLSVLDVENLLTMQHLGDSFSQTGFCWQLLVSDKSDKSGGQHECVKILSEQRWASLATLRVLPGDTITCTREPVTDMQIFVRH